MMENNGHEIELPNADLFFDIVEGREGIVKRGRFVPNRMAKWFLDNINIKTMGLHGMMYYYTGGVYQPSGEEMIHNYVSRILEDDSTSRRAAEVVFNIKAKTFNRRQDAPPWIVNVQNGLLDTSTMQFSPHTPEIFSTSQLPAKYDPEADCPGIRQFISEIVKEDDIQVIQEIMGFLLLGDYQIQKAVMFIGEGSNGKSTLIELMRRLIGQDNTTNISLQDLAGNDFARSRLYGKMANLFADIPDQALQNTGFFKMLTGGDSMFGNVKFKEGFDFTNKAKLIFSCNKLPTAYDETDAFFRRWVFVNFPHKFEGGSEKLNILDDLTTEDEMSGLLNWSLVGLARLISNKKFSNSMTTEEIREHYARMSSPVAAFLMACIREDPQASVPKKELYAAFCSYCNENKLPAMADNTFAKKIVQSLGHRVQDSQETIEAKRVRVWKGLALLAHPAQAAQVVPLNTMFLCKSKNKVLKRETRAPCAACATLETKIVSDTTDTTTSCGIEKDTYNFDGIIKILRKNKGLAIPDGTEEAVLQEALKQGLIFSPEPGKFRLNG